MTKEQYKSWVKQFFKQTPKMPKKLFFEMVELADDLRFTKSNLAHHMESSFNSQDELNSIKAAHIFHYPDFTGQKCAKDFINQKALINFIKKLNKSCKTSFNLETLKFILSIPLSQGGKNDGLVLYADFNRATNQFGKISLHMNPSSPDRMPKITQRLKIKKSGDTSSEIENLEFLGFDLFPDGKCGLKAYQEIESLSPNSDKKAKEIFDQISSLKSIKTILLMRKLGVNTTSSPLEDVYFYCNNLGCGKLLGLSSLKLYKKFLRQINTYINEFKIIWIILKDKKLEFYFR